MLSTRAHTQAASADFVLVRRPTPTSTNSDQERRLARTIVALQICGALFPKNLNPQMSV